MYITYVLNYLREQNCKAKVISYPELINPDHSRELLGGLDGILVSINYIDPTTIRILQESKLPVVTYRHPFEGNFPFSQVITDVDSGMAMAMEQLALPPDEVPVLVYENTPCSQHLRSVFIKHLGKAGFANDRLEQYEVTPGRFSNSCYRLVRVRYKKFRDRIFFVTNDGIASHLINAFLNENMKAGRDYRLVSSGNSEVYGLELPGGPLLASISTPREKKAEESCKLLMYLIRHPGDCQHIVKVPSLFTNRASSTISK